MQVFKFLPMRPHDAALASGLPIVTVLDELARTLRDGSQAVVQAPPGAGKTTIIPLALLDAPWLDDRRIVMLEPRRLAARAAASRMARLLGERVGDTVGYRVRLDTRIGPATRIEVVTEGILTRLLVNDPTLDRFGMVIFDEFHERSLHADSALALTLQTKHLVRPELRLVAMSATLDGTAVASLLSNAPIIASEGKQYPVDVRYLPSPAAVPRSRVLAGLARRVGEAVREVLADTPGDVLVFLPGAAEIHRVGRLLGEESLPTDVAIHALHGMLGLDAQDRALAPAPAGTRKVVLATSIAETSLTIEGVRTVIDSGFARVPRFSPRTGMTSLETVRVSRAAAEQRRGRAGRVAAGTCYRLWAEAEMAHLLPFAPPEILQADLAPLALELAVAGITNPTELQWLDPPPAAAYAAAVELLQQLGALDRENRLTPHGRRMATFGAHPRLAHMILRATEKGLGALAADLAALLGERDPLRTAQDGPAGVDIRWRLDLLREGQHSLPNRNPQLARTIPAVHALRTQAAHWRRLAGARPNDYARDHTGPVLALAYPDRVAQRRPGHEGRFLLRMGAGAVLPEGDAFDREPFLVVAESDGRRPSSGIRLAAPLTRADIEEDFADQIVTEERVEWDDATDRLLARRQRRLGAIVLDEHTIAEPEVSAIAQAITAAVQRRGLGLLPMTEEASRLRDRLRTLHRHDASWPDVSDEGLTSSILPRLADRLRHVRSAADLRRIDMHEALRLLLTPAQHARLDQLAPTHFVAPTGSRIPIDYSDPVSPAVAVRLQELFGCAVTPTILRGKVPLTLRLLSPAQRPVQVTRDLAGFWRTSYFDVRKDLRGRYPKHHWPDDPLAAPPTARAKKRER